MGTAPVKVKKAGLGRGRNPAARQSLGSATADVARFIAGVGYTRKGCGHGQVTFLT